MIRPALSFALAATLCLGGCGGSSNNPSPGHDGGAGDAASAIPDGAPNYDSGALPTDANGGRNTGAPCTGDSQCKGPNAVCLKEFDNVPSINTLYFPNGYCSSDCTGGDDGGIGGTCGDDGYCLNGSTYGMPVKCLLKCASDAQCRTSEGYACIDILGIFAPNTFCFDKFY
jgi:hypothetical protein